MSGFWRLTAGELLAGYARRDFSPVEVLAECFGRIEQLNPSLRAYLSINREDAQCAAIAAERAWLAAGEKPLLCGVPVSVKDTIEMRGLPTTYGSLAFKDNHQDDSEIVLRLRRAGAVILGKTNTPEFALSAWGRNRLAAPGCNPWNLEHTCGGSSGGAAAAVAAGLGQLAIGTDSGGSIRLPAAYNGVFGLKPSYQRIPTVQRWRAAPGRSHNGPLARTVHDAALLMQVLAGADARDPDSARLSIEDYLDLAADSPRSYRIAVSRHMDAIIDESALRALYEVAGLLRNFGCEVVDDEPPIPAWPNELEPGVWGFSGDHYAAAESLAPGFWERHAPDLTDYALPIYEAGRRALAWRYRQLLSRHQIYRDQVTVWFTSYNFLLTPLAGPAPRHEAERDGRDRLVPPLLAPFNIARLPAAAVPICVSSDGLPRAVQIVGRFGDDVGVLRLASVIEAALHQAAQWPPLAVI